MKKFSPLVICLLMMTTTSQAEDIKSLSLIYDEVEQGAGLLQMRYLVNDRFMRIDNGQDKADFVLFDVNSRDVYSVNHEDRTLLKISYQQWQSPEFDFEVSESESELKDAPKINQQTVHQYQLKANGEVCTGVAYLKGLYLDEMKVFHLYQQTLSGQQVVSLDNTPKEFHTPCYLVDQVYHSGDYYLKGLPVQISYSRGYEKYLKHFEEVEVDAGLFVLPEGYKEFQPFAH